jgi:hypothetical protein
MRTAETRLSSLKADVTHLFGGRTLQALPASKAATNFEQMAKISGRLMINSMVLTLTDAAIRDAVEGRNHPDGEILRFLSGDRTGTNRPVGQS